MVGLSSTFVNVDVEEHEALPAGCCLRFRAQSLGRPIARVSYESESGAAGLWSVTGHEANDMPLAATAYEVDGSSTRPSPMAYLLVSLESAAG